MNVVDNISTMFSRCEGLIYVKMPMSMTNVTNSTGAFRFCYSLEDLTVPALNNNGHTNISEMFGGCMSLKTLTGGQNIGSTTTATNAGNFFNNNEAMTGYTGNSLYSVFQYSGTVTVKTKLESLRLLNTGSTYGGSSPQINISYNDLGQAALVQVFNDLPTLTGKTINITGCTGAAALTAPERAIATGKGWTITG
jgi:hypothetical protein